MKKGGDDRRPVKPPCANFVSIYGKNSAHCGHGKRLSYVIRWFRWRFHAFQRWLLVRRERF